MAAMSTYAALEAQRHLATLRRHSPAPKRHLTRRQRRERLRLKAERARRARRMVLHGLCLVGVVIALFAEGGGHADWAFLMLAVTVELAP